MGASASHAEQSVDNPALGKVYGWNMSSEKVRLIVKTSHGDILSFDVAARKTLNNSTVVAAGFVTKVSVKIGNRVVCQSQLNRKPKMLETIQQELSCDKGRGRIMESFMSPAGMGWLALQVQYTN